MLIPLGIHIDKSCFPVHIGLGLKIAGGGTVPSHSGTHSRMFCTARQSIKLSRSVNLRIPQSVSCTIPMTGLLACGEMIWLVEHCNETVGSWDVPV